MPYSHTTPGRFGSPRNTRGRVAASALVIAIGLASGCASLTNPVADGVPVHRLPQEIFPPPRVDMKPIPLTSLRQAPTDAYRLGPGDVLGVYVEKLLGDPSGIPPVRMAETGHATPAMGYPILVMENGTIQLPYADPIPVTGLTLDEAQKAILVGVTEKKQLVPKDKARIIVTLMQPRRYHVIVVRQDTSNVGVVDTSGGGGGGGGTLGGGKRGSGIPLDLPAYENDVLNALSKSGGLPGLDARNEVIIYRTPPKSPNDPMPPVPVTIRIPLRMYPDDPLPFRPEDVILQNGDVVYIESRDTELFYTAGLLPAGEYVLPRDFDLDVVAAIARVKGPLLNAGFNQGNTFSGSVVTAGIGSPSPSLLTVLRKTANGRQMAIRVDLNRAIRDPRERILVQPGDILVLQEKPSEAIVRYATGIFRLNFLSTIIRQPDLTATGTLSVP